MRALSLFRGLRLRRPQVFTDFSKNLIDDTSADGTTQPPAALACQAEPEYIWPEDPDEVPTWRIAQEARAEMLGLGIPPYRTRRQFELAIELAEHKASIKIAPIAPLAALSPSESARRFHAYLQHEEDVEEFTVPELSAKYSEFCEHENLTPSHLDFVKAELALRTGVHRRQIDKKDPTTGKRQRPMMWIIAPKAEASDDIPFDLHQDDIRMAA